MEKLEMYDEKFKSYTKVYYNDGIEVPLGMYQKEEGEQESIIAFTQEEAIALYQFLGEVLKGE
ncbi:MAG: hypothetical protein WC449_04850 [Candidatus Paceibacterota bacterium]